MAERNQPQFYELKSQAFFEEFAKQYLGYLGNPRPNKTHITEMVRVLSFVWLRHSVILDIRLTDIEEQCLYLSSQGKTSAEIAEFCGITERQVKRYKEYILRELDCKNIAEAVTLGIRYNMIS